jgi:hypothetical protein
MNEIVQAGKVIIKKASDIVHNLFKRREISYSEEDKQRLTSVPPSEPHVDPGFVGIRSEVPQMNRSGLTSYLRSLDIPGIASIGIASIDGLGGLGMVTAASQLQQQVQQQVQEQAQVEAQQRAVQIQQQAMQQVYSQPYLSSNICTSPANYTSLSPYSGWTVTSYPPYPNGTVWVDHTGAITQYPIPNPPKLVPEPYEKLSEEQGKEVERIVADAIAGKE